MKKLVALILAAFLAMSFASCGNSDSGSSATESETSSVVSEESTDGSSESTDSSAADSSAESGSTDGSDAATVLKMDSIENVVEADGALAFTTTKSFEDTVKFYEEAVKTLNATGDITEGDLGDLTSSAGVDVSGVPGTDIKTWNYVGTYGADGSSLVISVNETAGLVSVSIQY